jgi:hypothetical protein
MQPMPGVEETCLLRNGLRENLGVSKTMIIGRLSIDLLVVEADLFWADIDSVLGDVDWEKSIGMPEGISLDADG